MGTLTQNSPEKRQTPADSGLQPISEFCPEDIFLAGYPKSGNTWLQYLVCGLAHGVDTRFSPSSQVQDLVPDVHATCFYRRRLTPTFFKTHHLPRPEYRRVVYLMRDGRDVAVSYFNFLAAIQPEPLDFLRLVQTGEGFFPCFWHEHIQQWLANPAGADMIVITYEGLMANTTAELRRLCEFAGLRQDADFLERVARNASFEMMRENERRFGWSNPAWPRDKMFVRRGKVGSFRDEMPDSVKAAFMKMAEPTLRKLGYPID